MNKPQFTSPYFENSVKKYRWDYMIQDSVYKLQDYKIGNINHW